MIDNQDNQFPVENEPEKSEIPENKTAAEETPAAPEPETSEETPAEESPAEEETAPVEETVPEQENTVVQDGFSEPPQGPAEVPAQAEQIPAAEAAEPALPTVEEPVLPGNGEPEPVLSQENTPGAPERQEIPPQPESPPAFGEQPPANGYGYFPGYPQGYQGYPVQNSVPPYGYQAIPQGYAQQPGEFVQQNREFVQQSREFAQQTPAQPIPPYGYPGGFGQPAPYPPQNPPQQPYQPVYYGYPGYPQTLEHPPKKKMSTGLKVFIWIASILAAAAIIGFGSYLAYTALHSPSLNDYLEDRFPTNPSSPRLPDRGDRNDRDKDEIPDFDDGVIPPEIDEGDPIPDVDVTPNTEGITIHPQPKGEELSAQEVYQKVVKSTVTVAVTYSQNGKESHSTGTGIIATSDGYIITNSHVVMNSKSSVVEITAYDGQQYKAVVVGVDRTTDLAILKTNDYDFTPAEFGDSELLEIGDMVIAIGNPGGEKFSGSMTGGYISGLDRAVGSYSENGMTYIQTDAAINPGNSGGPLVNMYGQVVGINSSKIVSDGYEGMGFAIPVTKAQSIINELLSGGYVKGRTRLGITGTDVTGSMAMLYNVPQGFVITEISEESAFTGTEAQPGDIIIALDGETVTGLTDISNLLLKHAPGDQATVTLYRQNGTELDVTITLLEDKGETQR